MNEQAKKIRALAANPAALAAARSVLIAGRTQSPLFDAARFAAELEDHLLKAWSESTGHAVPAPVVSRPVARLAPAPAPVIAAPVVPVPVPAAPAMPAPPAFVAPAAPAPTGVPFADAKGLIDYVMGAYKALGPQKGAAIQQVMASLGYSNINDVKPEHYTAFYQGIESLKG